MISASLRRLLLLALVTLAVLPRNARAQETRAFVTTTDFSTGQLRRIDLATHTVPPGATSVFTDTRVRWYNGLVYVVNRFGQDNVQVVDPATLATVHQFSTGNGSNPADVAFASGKMYVTRYELTDLLVMNPNTGATITTIPLGAFADADGIPEMDRMERVGPWLFVSCQRLDRNNGFVATDTSLVVVVDTRADTVVDVDPVTPGRQAIVLTGRNPVTPFAFDPASGNLLLGSAGKYGVLDAGIEWIDPVQMKSLGWAITEAALGGDLSALAWNGSTHSYAIVSDASFNTSLVSWSAASGTKLSTIFSPGGFSLADLGLDDAGELYVLDNNFSAPGVFVYRTSDDALVAGPLDTGLPPNQITFDRSSGDAASVGDGVAALALSAPWPNPARSFARVNLRLPASNRVRAEVTDLSGRRVRTLASGIWAAGENALQWNLDDERGARVASGIYFLRVRVGGREESRRIAVLR